MQLSKVIKSPKIKWGISTILVIKSNEEANRFVLQRFFAAFLLSRAKLESAVRDCFTHALRNAMDHGIEAKDVRSERGKPAQGKIWLDVVGELPAKPSVGLTEANASDPTFGPFIRGLEYANTTKFVNESAQRQLLIDLVERVKLEGMSVADSVAIAAEAEQKLLDEFYVSN